MHGCRLCWYSLILFGRISCDHYLSIRLPSPWSKSSGEVYLITEYKQGLAFCSSKIILIQSWEVCDIRLLRWILRMGVRKPQQWLHDNWKNTWMATVDENYLTTRWHPTPITPTSLWEWHNFTFRFYKWK